jgi:hypothetical protein
VVTVLLLIPALPFAGFVVNALFGRRLSKPLSGGLACLAMIAAFAVSVMSVWTLMRGGSAALQQDVFTWMSSGSLRVPFSLRLDHLASLMILVVTGIGSLIHIYSTGYMHEETDAEYARYFSYLNLFASFMLVLVLGASFLVMFVGWEGVGLCSYLLVGFWFRKKSAADAGHDQNQQRREMIEPKRERHVQVPRGDPLEHGRFDRVRRAGSEQPPHEPGRHGKRRNHHRTREATGKRFRQPPPEEGVDHEPGEREKRNQ